MPLILTGKKSDVEKYKKQRGVFGYEGFEMDPATMQQVVYGGLKRLGAQGVSSNQLAALENNPWVKYGPDFRLGSGQIAPAGTVEYVHKKELGGLCFKELKDHKKQFSFDDRLDLLGVANANIVDRYDERVNPAGGQFEHFLKNRVLLIDHFYVSWATVGRVQELMPESDGVKFSAFVGDASMVGGMQNLTLEQKRTMSLIAQALLQTVSIGFIAKKIRAPLYNDDGIMEEPAVIEVWELLEISIVAIPANPLSIFQAKSMAKSFYKSLIKSMPRSYPVLTATPYSGKNLIKANGFTLKGTNLWVATEKVEGVKQTKKVSIKQEVDVPSGTQIQTIVFAKENFTLEQATQWAEDHGFRTDKVDETEESYRIRQRPPQDFEDDTFRTIEIDTGIQAVIGVPKEKEDGMTEEQAKALVDGIKDMTGILKEVSTGISDLKGQNEKILGSIEGKGGGKPDEEEDMEKRLKTLEGDVTAQKETLKQIDAVLGGIADKLGLKAA